MARIIPVDERSTMLHLDLADLATLAGLDPDDGSLVIDFSYERTGGTKLEIVLSSDRVINTGDSLAARQQIITVPADA
jgi:hypothetical protein